MDLFLILFTELHCQESASPLYPFTAGWLLRGSTQYHRAVWNYSYLSHRLFKYWSIPARAPLFFSDLPIIEACAALLYGVVPVPENFRTFCMSSGQTDLTIIIASTMSNSDSIVSDLSDLVYC